MAALGSPLASAADVRRIATAECWVTEADLGLARALLPAVAQRGLLLYLEPEGQWLQFLGDATCVRILVSSENLNSTGSPVQRLV